MKYLVCIFVTVFSLSAFANLKTFECSRNDDKLLFTIGNHMGDGPVLYNIKFNDSYRSDIEQILNEILISSKKCRDLNLYLRLEKQQVLLCAGEMIVPNGIYGQVIMTNGAIEVFKNDVAPSAGWNCN